MKVAISVRIRNGHLAEAAKQFESQTVFAEWLGVSANTLCAWLNYRARFWTKSEKYDADVVASKLELICGTSIEEIFPAEVYANKAWLKQSKVAERIADMPVENLIACGAVPALPAAPDDLVEQRELREALDSALEALTPRDRLVIERRFGLSGEDEASLRNIASDEDLSTERVRQIEAKALRALRHPRVSRPLKRFLEARRS